MNIPSPFDLAESFFVYLGAFFRNIYIYIFPSVMSVAMQQRRIAVIQSRLHFLMAIAAIGLPTWAVLEIDVFPRELWLSLFEARLLAGAAFAILLFADRLFKKSVSGKIWWIYLQLGIVFVVPTLFYVYCARLPGPVFDANGFARTLINTYALIPLAILAFVGFFPLTFAEAASIVAPFLTAYYMTGSRFGIPLWSSDVVMMLGTSSVAMTSIVICLGQLHTLVQLVSYSSHDLLTNCLGRRSGEEVVKVLWHQSIRNKTTFSVAFVDLDHFKRVNDRFGHAAGDKVLANVANAIKSGIRKSDAVIRWGGEEFLVILPEADLEGASKVMQRVAKNGFGLLPDGAPQTVSIGLSERVSENVKDEKQLITLADERLFKAKMSGRSRIVGTETIVVSPTPIQAIPTLRVTQAG